MPLPRPIHAPRRVIAAALSRLSSALAGSGMRGHVDMPSGAILHRDLPNTFRGWALDGDRLATEVVITLDKQERHPAHLGIPRPDVPLYLREPGIPATSGWSCSVDLSQWESTRVRVQIEANGADGVLTLLLDQYYAVDSKTSADTFDSSSHAATAPAGLTPASLAALNRSVRLVTAAGQGVSSPPSPPAPTDLSLSADLQSFTTATPYVREEIERFVATAAQRTKPGCRVADIGAGEAPYRELFQKCDYVTVDWENSIHFEAKFSDVVATATALPFDDESFDVVLMTEVLEHMSEPGAALAEACRILRDGGTVYLTVPFVWILHELPYDFFRYTPESLKLLFTQAGFDSVTVASRGDYFTTVAQLMAIAPVVLREGGNLQELADQRTLIADAFSKLSGVLADLSPLDSSGLLPLGFNVTARKAKRLHLSRSR